MSWEVSGLAVAGEDVHDTAGAARALDRSIDRIREHADLSDAEDAQLRHSAAEARAQLLAEGQSAFKERRPWSIVVGRVRIALTPRGEDA
jgi:hypothetical protein